MTCRTGLSRQPACRSAGITEKQARAAAYAPCPKAAQPDPCSREAIRAAMQDAGFAQHAGGFGYTTHGRMATIYLAPHVGAGRDGWTLDDIWVAPEDRGHGAARRALQALIDIAASCNVWLHLAVEPHGDGPIPSRCALQRWYASLGFAQSGDSGRMALRPPRRGCTPRRSYASRAGRASARPGRGSDASSTSGCSETATSDLPPAPRFRPPDVEPLLSMPDRTARFSPADLAALPEALARLPRWTGAAYRAETGSGGAPGGTTAAEVIAYERDELGNDNAVSPDTLEPLRALPARRILWIAGTRQAARRYGLPADDAYGDPQALEQAWQDADQMLTCINVVDCPVLGADGDGGYLLLLPPRAL